MLSYRLALKLNDFHQSRAALVDLLIVFKACGGPNYFKNVGIALAHLDYLERINHPAYAFISSDVSSFVEEPGEIAFGVLGNLETRSGKQPDDFEVFRSHFRLLNTYVTTFHSLSGVDDRKPSKYVEYDDSALETVMLNAWMIELVEDCVTSSFLPYCLVKYKNSNLPILREVVFADAEFQTSCIADDFPVDDVLGSVEDMIKHVHRLWRTKRKARDT